MTCPCISNQIFSTASMAISFGLPSIGLRLGNLLNKIEAKNKQETENLQKTNNNKSPNGGNKGQNTGNNFNGGNNSSNRGNNSANIGNNFGNNDSNKGNNGSNDNNKLNKIKGKIPPRLKNKEGNINTNLFTIRLKGKKWYKEKKGFIIDKDTAGHNGKVWKLRDKKGTRICSIDGNGKILSK